MAAPSPSPGQTLGHFLLIEEIGSGGFGIVYRARDQRLERDVAVKVLNAKRLSEGSARQRFRNEALILSRLNHPNVEAVYDFHSEQGHDYLVMEYVAGVSLEERLAKGTVPEKEVLELGIQLARGLAAAHAQRVIHRDLKPANLKVTPDNVLKILDFGLAQLFAFPEDETVSVSEMPQHPSAGTPAYLSPEQVELKDPDTRSDIYSAGVVLYELATGAKPFPQHGQMLRDAILHSLPPAPRLKNKAISPGLEAVILKCLEKDPALRYQSATELLDDLKELARDTGPRRAVGVRAARGWKSKRGWIVVAVLIAVLIGAVGLRNKVRDWFGHSQPPAQQKIMAVLPIDTVGQDPATSALALGLTETVTAKLVQASDSDAIQVVSPQDLRDKGVKTAEEARREFGTDLILEGSLQRSEQKIRINCYLVDSRTHRQLASKTIEAEVGDPFGLQDRVVSAALDMLPTQIAPEQRRKFSANQDTQPAAYEAYIRGRGYLQEYEKAENIDSAIREFNTALKIDPNYALAYAALGKAYLIGFEQSPRDKDWIVNASRNCEKALSLNSQLVEGHVCLGNLFNRTGEYGKAVGEFERAVQADPANEDALRGLADAYTNSGNLAAAESTYKRAIALRPNYWGVYSWLGFFYYTQARYADAADMFRKATLLAPDNYRGYSNLAGTYALQGRYADAIEASKHSIELRPNLEAYANLGYAYFLLHKFSDAVTVLEDAVKIEPKDSVLWGNLADGLYWAPGRRAESSQVYNTAISLARSKLDVNPRDAGTLAYIADYYAMIGDKQSAFNFMQRALEAAPSDPEVLFRSSLVYNHFNDTEQTLALLKKAVDARYSRTVIRDTPDFEALRPRLQVLLGAG